MQQVYLTGGTRISLFDKWRLTKAATAIFQMLPRRKAGREPSPPGVQVFLCPFGVIVMQQFPAMSVLGWIHSTRNELALRSSVVRCEEEGWEMSCYATYCQDQGMDCARRARLANSPEVATYWRRLGFRWISLAEHADGTRARGHARREGERASFHFHDLDLERETIYAKANADARSP
jgi:hypothetical protein